MRHFLKNLPILSTIDGFTLSDFDPARLFASALVRSGAETLQTTAGRSAEDSATTAVIAEMIFTLPPEHGSVNANGDDPGAPRDFGNLKPIHELTEHQGSMLASRVVLIRKSKAGDGATVVVYRLKLWDKMRALEGLMKHFGPLTHQIELSAGDDLIAILHEGRAKTAALRMARDEQSRLAG